MTFVPPLYMVQGYETPGLPKGDPGIALSECLADPFGLIHELVKAAEEAEVHRQQRLAGANARLRTYASDPIEQGVYGAGSPHSYFADLIAVQVGAVTINETRGCRWTFTRKDGMMGSHVDHR